MITDLVAQLNRDEGRKRSAYQDHLGFWTIGVGRLIDARKNGGLRDDEIEYLLRNDINDRINTLHRDLAWFQNLDDARKGALVNMAFQLGTTGLLGFKTTLELIGKGEYLEASKQMLKSLWATQTPERAKRLARQIETGVWQ